MKGTGLHALRTHVPDLLSPSRKVGPGRGWHDPTYWKASPFYRALAKEIAGPGHWLVQCEPNLRVHSPGAKSVPWHTDADFGHLSAEWNVWVPLTEMTDDSQRLWIKGERGTYPVHVPLEHAFVFHGATTRHGVIRNRTDTTRYSFDFRLLPLADYRDQGKVSVRYGVPLRLGDYWREL